MRSLPCLAVAAAALSASPASSAQPPWADGELKRNGAVSRLVWAPGFASGEIGGYTVSAGLAIGLRGAVRDNLDRSAAPTITLQLDRRARLSLLPAGSSGAMLVLESRH